MSTPPRGKQEEARVPRSPGPLTPPPGRRVVRAARRPLWRRLVAAYEAAQVETRGRYSVERMLALDAFARTRSLASCVLALVATPLPCVAVAIFVDAVPLNPSRLGLAHSHWFWLRVALVTFCITFTILEQLRAFVPRLDATSTRVLVMMSSVIAVGCTAYALLMAYLVGYPIPFTLFFGAPSWQVLFWGCVALQWGRQLRADRTLRHEVVAFYKVVIVQLSLTAVYPAYNHVFARLDGWPQTACALGLSVLKLLAKNAFHAVFQHAEDFLPEVIIFNVEIFHALFVAACMQSSKSFATTAVVIVADLAQIVLHMLDVDAVLRKLQRLDSKKSRRSDTPPQESSATPSPSMIPPPPLTAALLYVAMDRSLHSDPLIRLQTLPRPSHARQANAVVPLKPQQPTNHPQPTSAVPAQAEVGVAEPSGVVAKLERLSKAFGAREIEQLERTSSQGERRAHVATVLRLLYFVECLVLIEFVEVVVPLVYCLYLVAIAHMPNREFYPQLAVVEAQGSSLSATVGSIVAYTVLELATFLGLCLLLRYKLRLSPVKQLAFVLRRQWKPVQSKMVLWVVVVVGSSLEQFGYDYTFKFAWLRSQPPDT